MFALKPLQSLACMVLTEYGKCIDRIIIHEQLFALPRTEKNDANRHERWNRWNHWAAGIGSGAVNRNRTCVHEQTPSPLE